MFITNCFDNILTSLKTIPLPELTDELYPIMLCCLHIVMCGKQTHNIGGDKHWLYVGICNLILTQPHFTKRLYQIRGVSHHAFVCYEGEFEDTKGVIRIRKSKKDRQHNSQQKKNKRTINDLQRITHKTKDGFTGTPLKNRSELRCSGRVSNISLPLFLRFYNWLLQLLWWCGVFFLSFILLLQHYQDYDWP